MCNRLLSMVHVGIDGCRRSRSPLAGLLRLMRCVAELVAGGPSGLSQENAWTVLLCIPLSTLVGIVSVHSFSASTAVALPHSLWKTHLSFRLTTMRVKKKKALLSPVFDSCQCLVSPVRLVTRAGVSDGGGVGRHYYFHSLCPVSLAYSIRTPSGSLVPGHVDGCAIVQITSGVPPVLLGERREDLR